MKRMKHNEISHSGRGRVDLCGQYSDKQHVHFVDIGSFLPVDFDVDEMIVHQLCDGSVFERFVFHDVAPVASRIADR